MKVVPIVAVHDGLIGYKNINISQNAALAIRGFTNSLIHLLNNDEFGDISPSDMSLYHVGDFDLDTGEIIPCEPKLLVSGINVVTEWRSSKVESV